MADSNSITIDSVMGRYGTYVIKNRIGKGGNGEVYVVEIENKVSDTPEAEGYVLKLLILNNHMNDEEKKRREERFRREAKIVSTKFAHLKGIIPIFDSSYANTGTEYPYQWYLMPEAEPFHYKNYSIEERVGYMMQVAETISAFHKQNLSHRDIKPDNMLIYNNRLCLTDFGLVWSDSFDTQITCDKEAVGPAAIRPPELEAPVNQDGSMFLKSDVYLFAKTLWILLTGIRKGFYKRYSRTDDEVYLKSLVETSHTLEPIHQLIENATFDNYAMRISIDECCKLLVTQREVFQHKIAETDLAELRYIEAYTRAQQSAKPDEIIISSDNEIQKLLSSMSMSSRIIISELGKDYELGLLCSGSYIEPNVFEIATQSIFGSRTSNIKRFCINISNVRMGNDNKCIVSTDRFKNPEKYGVICNKLHFLTVINGDRVCIDGKFEVRIVP